ncbi:MAG TPA: ABC transporter permease [Candidatus Binatus sp.]|nr:ABC transporter permease [Candidatus Binatus sp.]
MGTYPSTSRFNQILGEFKAAFIKDVRVFLRYPSWVASEFITTPLWFVFFALGVYLYSTPGKFSQTVGNAGTLTFFYWGFIFLIIFSTSIWGIGQYIRTEQLQGTIEQLFLAPVSRVTIIFGRFLRTFFTDMIFIGYTAGLITFFSHETVPIVNPLLFIPVFAFLELGVLGFGLLFAGVAFRVKSFNLLANLTQFAIIGICGLFFPVTVLPHPVSLLSLMIPFTYFTDLLRYTSTGCNGCTIFEPSLEVPLAFLSAIALFFLGLGFFKIVEASAQKRGTIGTH